MTTSGGAPGRGRTAAAASLSLALLVAGVVLSVAAGAPAYDPELPLPLLLGVLLPAYVLGHRHSLDFEFRRESSSVTLVQLPLALGVQIVAPLAHLAVRLVAVVLHVTLHRQPAQKVLYNLGAAAFELGAAAFAVGTVAPGETGPMMWLALYAGLAVGDVVGALVLNAIWRVLGLEVSATRALRTLALTAPVSLLFTGLAIVAISAARVEPLTAGLMLALAVWLGVAYRAHRKVVAQQASTEQLYSFVKELGPLTIDSHDAVTALEQVRLLLHSERLELAVPRGERWCRLIVADGVEHQRDEDHETPAGRQSLARGASTLRSRRQGREESMATPLVGSSGLVGILTANARMGDARGFDMGDLRLLETIGAELSMALERGRLHADLERAATRDALTGLRNLSQVTSRLEELISAAPDEGVLLAAVAVDSFREVNDTLGHQVGDELLLEVTRRLLLACPTALVGRIGGGRFAVAVPAHEAGDDPEMFGLGLRSRIEGTTQIGAVGTHIRLSVGVVRGPEHGSDAATLIRRAETAMYSARHAHGGPVLWEPAYEVQGQRRLAVVTALREALAGGAISVAFQPKVQTATGRVAGVEALARWTHPALGPVRPDEFIPLAEASGLMGPLTTSVLRQSLVACKGWQSRSAGVGVGVAVNVSADTVLDPGFVTEVAAILSSVGVGAELLTLELTEGVVVSDPRLAAVRMGELRALGLKLSVDDFGTGYSSLTYLKGLPVDEVKIDKGFVDDLASDPADRAVVRAVVDIAHTLGLRVVAEGVEQEDQQAILGALGVDEMQGYLHARPMPFSEVVDWLKARDTRARV